MKLALNYFIDLSMIILFAACAITGLVKLPELNVLMSDQAYLLVSFIHDWSGVASTALMLTHLLLHMKWLRNAGRTIFRKKVRSPDGSAKQRRIGKASAAFLVLVALSANAWAFGDRHASNATVPQRIDYATGSIKDGTYTGTANGYMPNLKVAVTVEGGKIANIAIVQNSESARWFTRVVNAIPTTIIKKQSTDIESVSGATCSSYGIMSAVENALKAATK